MRKRGALIDIVYYLLIFYSKMEINKLTWHFIENKWINLERIFII